MSYRGRGGAGGGGHSPHNNNARGGGQQGRGGGSGGRGGGRGGGSPGSSGYAPSNPGFNSPPPARGGRGGGRGGGAGHFSPQPQFGGGGGYSPGNGSPQQFHTPQRSASAGFHANSSYGKSPAARFGQPSFGGGGGSGGKFVRESTSNLVTVGAFNLDERMVKSSVALSLRMGMSGLEDAHVASVIIPYMRNTFIPYVRTHYSAFRREQIQMNLELQDNYLTSKGITALCGYLCEVVSAPDTPFRLTALKFWNNAIADEGCESLGQLLVLAARCDAPIVELHLSHNQVSEKGAAALFNAVYSYARADTLLTKIDTRGDAAVAAASASAAPSAAAASISSSAASSPSSFVLASNCVDTGVVLSAPLYPLWLRLEWNQINYSLFAKHFHWLRSSPEALKKEAKRQRKLIRKASSLATAGDETASSVGASTPTSTSTPLTRQSSTDSQAATDVDESDPRHSEETESDAEQSEAHDHDESEQHKDAVADGEEAAQAATPAAAESKVDDAAEALAALSLESSDAAPAKSLSFALPPEGLRICPAADRKVCAVRTCRYPNCAAIHLCFFTLQHQSFEQSDLLHVLQKQRKERKLAKPQPLNEKQQGELVAAAQAAPAAAATPSEPASAAASSAASAAPADPIASAASAGAASSSSAFARPLVIFLDTNSVFGMISARHETQQFHWDKLYELAVAGRFGCFKEPERCVHIMLCSAVLQEMDARKEYSKKAESGPFAAQRATHLSTLAKQIKQQFQMSVADQSQGFLARAKNLGGVGKGFVTTVSIAQGEMNVHASHLPNHSDVRNTSNDRRILNATLHWVQEIGETGIAVLMTDDRNLANLAQSENVPTVSLHSLDRALSRPQFAGQVIDSTLLRAAIASCSQDLHASLSHENARPAPRMDKNVYECLADAYAIVSRAVEHPDRRLDGSPEEIAAMLECWTGILANAPQLLTTLRKNKAAAAAKSPEATPSPAASASPVASTPADSQPQQQ